MFNTEFDTEKHHKEVADTWQIESGVDPGIVSLNVNPMTGADLFDLMYPNPQRLNSGRLNSHYLKQWYKFESTYGWACNGRFRWMGGEPIALDKGKPRKYSTPPGQPSPITFLKVTERIWQKVSERCGIPMPEHIVLALDGEASGFWNWVVSYNVPVYLTEGEKKAGCLLSHGYAGISIPGINMGYRVTEKGEWITKKDGTQYQKAVARELHESLKDFDTPGRNITMVFDYRVGDYSQSQEFKAARTTAKLFKSAIAKIAILPGPDKGVDDFIVAGGDVGAILDAATQQADEDWQQQKWLRFKGFSADRKITAKYFDAEAPESGKITAIKSGLGSGKTEHIKRKVASDKAGVQINIGYRNSLLLQQSAKWGFYHLDEHNGYQFFSDPNARLSLCFDSLLKIPIEMFAGATVILDESASAIKHLLTSHTISDKRLEVLERFEAICKACDRIVLSDGNQSDLIVNYVKALSGKDCTNIENDFAGDAPPVFFVNAGKKNEEWLSREILNSLCPAVATDSLREAEALALRLEVERGPGLLLTSKTATEKWVKELLAAPDEYIKLERPNWVVYTPTAESGVDISIPEYFSDTFCWFTGVVRVDECLQMSRRVRNPERIVVLCPDTGLGSRNKGGFFEAEIIKAFSTLEDTEAQLLLNDEALLQKCREDLAAQILNPHTILWAKLQAKAELERLHLRQYLFKAFELGGYSVSDVDPADCTNEGHARARQETKDIEAQDIFNAPDIELAEALEIKRNYSAAWPERCQAIKCLLKARLPGIEGSSLWTWEFVRRIRFEDRSLLSQLDAAWQFENPDDAQYLQRSKWLGGKREFLGDYSDRWLKIKALKALGLERFLEPDRIWSGESPEVLELFERCKKKAIANLLGHPGKMKPMQWLNKLLSLIGCKLAGKNVKQNGVQHREYSYIAELSRPANWDELAAFTAEKQAKKISELKEAEALAAQELEAVAPPPVFDTNLGGDATIPDKEVEAAISPTPIANLTGWVNRWGKWVAAKVIGWCKHGTTYRVEFQNAAGEFSEMFVFPDKFRWDAPT